VLQLKQLFRLTSAAVVTVGISLCAASAQAVQLTLFNGFSVNTPNNRFDFSYLNVPAGNTKLDIKGTVAASSGFFATSTGQGFQGTILNLTSLTVVNRGSSFFEWIYDPKNPESKPFMSFTNKFSAPSFSSGFAQQLLSGSLIGANLAGTNKVTFNSGVNNTYLSEINSPNRSGTYAFNVSNGPVTLSNIGIPTMVGQLRSVRLGVNETLSLPNSACSTLTEIEISFAQSEKLCNRAAGIPEPSSVLSLLALGALGAGFVLKHKQRLED
jgi:hypothetical protein